MAEDGHAFDTKFLNQHVKVKASEGGACLNRHEKKYIEDNSCSHRWQAYLQALNNKFMYNWPVYMCLAKTNDNKSTFTTSLWGKKERTIRRPKQNEWNLTESSWRRKKDSSSPKKIPNFRGNSYVPYQHNAHHIIPNSVLNNCIAESAEYSIILYTLIRSSLLQAKYNLNEKINMILLPMEKEICAAMGLPRHIAGIEGNIEKGKPVTREDFFKNERHDVYSTKIKSQIKDIFQSYAREVDNKKHEKIGPKLDKSKLETISKSIFERLREWQCSAKTGAPIDDVQLDNLQLVLF
jgi:hypothetical protein